MKYEESSIFLIYLSNTLKVKSVLKLLNFDGIIICMSYFSIGNDYLVNDHA